MQIIITGGAGFIGQRLANEILNSTLDYEELLLVDLVSPSKPQEDPRLKCLKIDLSDVGRGPIITKKTGIVFHLAAVVSSHAETDFDLGWKVNLDLTRQLLQECRSYNPAIKFIFTSSLAVFGGNLPDVVNDSTAVTPQSSYGIQKAMGELLVNDFSRKKYVDGRVLRLPTICVRPGKPNKAASSFVSSIIREPLNGEEAICPVSPDLPLWLSSPDTLIQNIIKAATLDAYFFGNWLTVNLPGIGITVQGMLNALEQNTDKTTRSMVKFKLDEGVNKIVSTWPGKVDNERALEIGFKVDHNFDDFIKQFMKTEG